MRAHLWDAGTHVDYDRGLAYCLGQVRTALGDTADTPLRRERCRGVAIGSSRPFRRMRQDRGTANGRPTSRGLHRASPRVGAEHAAVPTSARGSSRTVAALAVGRLALVLLVAVGIGWTAWARMMPGRARWSPSRSSTTRPAVESSIARPGRLPTSWSSDLPRSAPNIGVIGNTPSLRVPRAQRAPAIVRRETGAGYFVFGQVQDDDAGVRLVVHLIRLDDDTHLWVTRVARSPRACRIQDVVADRLAEAVRRHVIDRDPDSPSLHRAKLKRTNYLPPAQPRTVSSLAAGCAESGTIHTEAAMHVSRRGCVSGLGWSRARPVTRRSPGRTPRKRPRTGFHHRSHPWCPRCGLSRGASRYRGAPVSEWCAPHHLLGGDDGSARRGQGVRQADGGIPRCF